MIEGLIGSKHPVRIYDPDGLLLWEGIIVKYDEHKRVLKLSLAENRDISILPYAIGRIERVSPHCPQKNGDPSETDAGKPRM